MNAGSNKKQVPAFLEKLFEILDENSSYVTLISWQPDGKSFLIKKVNEFSELVLPKYFKHSNIQSCVRQLNMYGFSKTRHGSNFREYSHKMFLRGRKDLLVFIKRKALPASSLKNRAVPGPNTNNERPLGFIKSEPGYGYNESYGQDFEEDEDEEEEGEGSDEITTTGGHNETNRSDSSYDEYPVSSSLVMQLIQRVETLEDRLLTLSAQYSVLQTAHNQLCDSLSKTNSSVSGSGMEFNGEKHHSMFADCKVESPPPRKQPRLTEDGSSSSSSSSSGAESVTATSPLFTTNNSSSNNSNNQQLIRSNSKTKSNNSYRNTNNSGSISDSVSHPQFTFFDAASLPNPFPIPSRYPYGNLHSSANRSQFLTLGYGDRTNGGFAGAAGADGEHSSSRRSSSSNNNNNNHHQDGQDEDGATGKKRRYSIDIGGLEAISLAATMLDHHRAGHGTSSSSGGGVSSSSSTGAGVVAGSAAVMAVTDPHSGELAAAVVDCDYLLSMNGGDTALRKAYSIG